MDAKLSVKQNIIIASTLFGMLFGAGNLIFPVHLGQMAGAEFIPASLGFVIAGVGIPILGIIAIGASKSDGLFVLTNNISRGFAYFLTTVLYLAIGPCFVMPRSASISFNSGLGSIIGDSFNHQIAFLIFSVVFFAIVTFFSLRPSGITTWIGKIINPIFLVFLGVLLIIALINPLADIFSIEPTPDYVQSPFFNGFQQGYATMDALAGLAFGIILINIVKDMGVKSASGITKSIVIPSLITGGLMVLIYTSTIIMGAQSRGVFDLSSNGSIALNQISNYYFGIYGDAVLFIIVTLASIKTSIGLTTSCSETFLEMYPNRFSYKKWASIFIAISFSISNIGLDNIIEISTPVLSFLYPIAIVLIILAFSGKHFEQSSIVYKWTVGLTCIPAFFGFLAGLPLPAIDFLQIHGIVEIVGNVFPFSDIGFGWVIPSILGFVIGLTVYKFKNKSLSKAD